MPDERNIHTHERFPEPADVLEALQVGASAPAEESTGPRPMPRPALVEQFAAIVRTSPCSTNVSSDYPDARYYLDRAVPSSGLTSAASLAATVDALPGVKQCLTATNLAELAAGTHLLPAGTVVQVFALYARDGTKLYAFNQPPAGAVVVKITGTAGGGKYTGRILTGASSASAAGNLSMPEGMSVPAADNALVLNEEEDGLSGHRLAVPCYAVGSVAGVSQGLNVVMIRGALGATGGGSTLGDGTGGPVAADSSSWSRSSSATPLVVWAQTRTVWDPSGGVLYAYLRSFTFDARGMLISVSGENQITVDVPVACQ